MCREMVKALDEEAGVALPQKSTALTVSIVVPGPHSGQRVQTETLNKARLESMRQTVLP